MEKHSTFDIPLDALAQGLHDFRYGLDDAFFGAFESELVTGGDVAAHLSVERLRGQFTFALAVEGSVLAECDRCLGHFSLPIEGRDELIVKFGAADAAPAEGAEVIYVPAGAERFNVAKFVYDIVGLSVPMSKVHEDAGLECDPEMTRYLDPEARGDASDAPSGALPPDSPWSILKQLKQPDNP